MKAVPAPLQSSDAWDAGVIPLGAELELLDSSSAWAEGIVWIPETRGVRWSDIPNNRILEWSAETRSTRVVRNNVGFTNGRTLDRQGQVIQCSHTRRGIEREDAAGNTELLVDRWEGGRFHSPNDVIVARDGSIWFTDPPYGLRRKHSGEDAVREYEGNFVFRLDTSDGTVTAEILDTEEPNGLAFSPDEEYLYVADSSSHHRTDGSGNHCIWRYRRSGSGWSARELFAEVRPGIPDGIRVDSAGRVWSSSADSVRVFSPSGSLLARIPVPEVVSNLAFGGDSGQDLFIAAVSNVYRLTTTTHDATASYPPEHERARYDLE